MVQQTTVDILGTFNGKDDSHTRMDNDAKAPAATTMTASMVRRSKAAWRKAAVSRRLRTTVEERLQAGTALAQQARRNHLFHSFTTVAAFVSMGSEIAMAPLLRTLFGCNCEVLVPRLGNGLDIGWSELESLDDLRSQRNPDGSVNGRRPQEPDNPSEGPASIAKAGLIIVPALAVDRNGFRLGRGGGWYDRALEYRTTGARVVAVCWPWELIDRTVPHEPHDIPVDGALTPTEFSWFSPVERHDGPSQGTY